LEAEKMKAWIFYARDRILLTTRRNLATENILSASLMRLRNVYL
mgnify:CR=1